MSVKEWKIDIVENIIDIIDYRGKTPEKSETGIPTLSAKSVKMNYIDYSKSYFISQDTYDKFMVRGFPKKGDILMTTEAPLGCVAKLDRDDVGIAQRLLTLRGKHNIIDNSFLLYYLQSPLGQHKLNERASGTTVTGIKQKEFRQMEVIFPHIETQKQIAQILSSIDDKIELNNKINDNLEQQAQAIFKSWFVDFEPFGGVMPSDWNYISVGDICDSVSKTHNKKESKLIFLNTGDITKGIYHHSTYSDVATMPGQAKKSIQLNDILYSEIRPMNQHFAFVNISSEDYVVSTKLMVIRTKKFDSRRLYQFLTLPEVITELQVEAESRSGTFPQIRFENVSNLNILVATKNIEERYCSIINSVYLELDKNIEENRKLAQLRDTLLPKLMSGEIDVSNICIGDN